MDGTRVWDVCFVPKGWCKQRYETVDGIGEHKNDASPRQHELDVVLGRFRS